MRRYVLEINQDGPKVTECSTHINDLHQLFDAFDLRLKEMEGENRALCEALFGINAGKPVSCSEMVAEILRLQRLASQAEACTNLALNAIEDYDTLFQFQTGKGNYDDGNDEDWTDIALNNIAVSADAERERALQERGGWRQARATEFGKRIASATAVQPDLAARTCATEISSANRFGFPL